ncbi:MAG: Ig-like domain-containing protein, partial [Planctomycetota bacterium]
MFDTPGSAVPIERIRYIGASLEIVGDGVEFPVAVDDSPIGNVPLNSAAFPINVLDNDLPGSTGTISIDNVTNGSFGTTRVDGDRILYTPTAGFEGTDQFVYTIVDAAQRRASATVTVDVGDAAADDIVALRIAVTDVNGQPIDQVELGSQFQVRGFVEDLRGFGLDRGVFAAYEDVLYNRGLVSPVASQTNDPDLGFEVQFGPNYQRVREGDIRTDGVINEIGAVQVENGNQPLGLGEQLLFVITMTANNIGTAEFIADPADITPLHDTLTFEPPTAVPFDRIRYGFDTVAIVAPG